VIAVAAPLISELPVGLRLPIVVVEIVLGIVVGPHGLGIANSTGVLGFLGLLGLTFLFFLAGFEIDFDEIRGRPMALATGGWGISLALALAVVAVFWWIGFVRAPILTALCFTTTALGTLLPILRDAGELRNRFGSFILAAGAAGELYPILAISIILTQPHGRLTQSGLMLTFVIMASVAVGAALRVRAPRMVQLFARTMHASSQLPVRLCVLLLVALVVLAQSFGLDIILGAVTAGLIVALGNRGQQRRILQQKLDAIGFGFLIPIFFVTSGIKFDLSALLEGPVALLRVPLYLLLFLVIRGLPVFLYRGDLQRNDLLPFAFYSSTALPLVVAITEVGLATGRMRTDSAAALVGAAVLSVLIFPLLALVLRRRAPSAVLTTK
jgi:Kef-type K+ transport system membrane component KefB